MVTESEILKIAHLAKLSLKEDEIKKFSEQLSSILLYIKKLDEVDTSNVLPTSHPIDDVKNRFSTDDQNQTLQVSDVLKNANKTKDSYIVTQGVFK